MPKKKQSIPVDKLKKQQDHLQQLLDGRDKHFLEKFINPLYNTNDPYFGIKAFRNCIYSGITPPADLLCEIAEAFNRYIEGDKEMDLDTAFNIKGKSGKSVPSRYKSNENWEKILVVTYFIRRRARDAGQNLAVRKAAEQAIAVTGLIFSVDTVEKEYSKRKIENLFDKQLSDYI